MPLVKQVELGVTPEHGFGKATGRPGSRRLMFGLFGKRQDRLTPVKALFARVAEASRDPALYVEGGVPDTFEGRFDSLALHAFLVMRRLRQLPAPAADLAQDFVDACFAYLELGFRNGGISDIAVPKRMKKIARSFYGRIQAYEDALAAAEPEALSEALARNLCAPESAALLAGYARRSQVMLAELDLDALLARPLLFPPIAAGRAPMTADPAAPRSISHPIRVETVRQRGTPAVVDVDASARARVAAELDIASLESLSGRFTLTRNGERVRLEGFVDAAFHQTCIVTLEPFAMALSVPVRLDFLPEDELAAIAARASRDAGEGEIDVEVSLNEDDPPEPIVDGIVDLGAVMLEFLALSLDPYPRKPGAAFETSEPDIRLQSPFAALARLKRDE